MPLDKICEIEITFTNGDEEAYEVPVKDACAMKEELEKSGFFFRVPGSSNKGILLINTHEIRKIEWVK